ncbi:YbaB/EbfC family nucleoid-associated protein [Umezawaea beigongshangensis]|uniref:YbaB/EbfC family nucleoid-associated protein n=1 Tax=Umezawaea beigongshangensis TaxID=2780383 RepID=UPI0018F190EF|nr:YbaB/EbfC family nucleoid-associated protein [Umezawaea beigongshangensis]
MVDPAVDPHKWLEDYESQLAELQKKNETLQKDLAEANVTLASSDGSVTVSVGPNGGLTDLKLSTKAVDLGSAKLTALILQTMRKAQHQVSQKVVAAFTPMGEGKETMEMLMDSVAPDPDLELEEEIEDPYAIEDEDPEIVRKRRAQTVAAARRSRAAAPDDEDEEPW